MNTKLVNAHTSQRIKIIWMGKVWKLGRRVSETCLSETNSVNPLYLLVKDHKVVKPGASYKTRSVSSSMKGMAYHINNLEPVVDSL